jgi:hypothetical protein
VSNNYWENHLFPQFLQSVDSYTLSDFTNFEIQNQLNYLVIRALNDFKFAKVDLNFEFDETINDDTMEPFGYYFTSEEVKQPEFSVILARMKQYWIEFQISQERLFANAYYDRDIRLHSPGNTMDKLIKMFTTFRETADRAEFNYGRVSIEGTPTLGDINE